MIDPRAHGMMYSPEPMHQQWAGRNPMQGQPMQIPPAKNPSMGGFGFAGMQPTGPLPALPPPNNHPWPPDMPSGQGGGGDLGNGWGGPGGSTGGDGGGGSWPTPIPPNDGPSGDGGGGWPVPPSKPPPGPWNDPGFDFAGLEPSDAIPALPPGNGGGPGDGWGPWDPSQNAFDFGQAVPPGGEVPKPIPNPGPGGSPGPGGNGPDLPNPDPWNPIPQGPGGFDSGKGVGPLWPTPQPKAPPLVKVGMPAPQPGAQYSTGGGQYQPIANSPFFGGNK